MSTIKNEVFGVGRYRQNKGGWENEKYNFGYWRSKSSYSETGCTPTSVTNILAWTMAGQFITNERAPNPSDTNNKRSNFWYAFGRTKFRDLTFNNKQLSTQYIFGERCVLVERLEKPIPKDSPEGKALIKMIKRSILQGKPVLIGVCGGPSHTRHSIVGAGIDSDDNILVVDPWTAGLTFNKDPKIWHPSQEKASFAPLDLVMFEVGREPKIAKGYDSFDMSFEATRLFESWIEKQEAAEAERRKFDHQIYLETLP